MAMIPHPDDDEPPDSGGSMFARMFGPRKGAWWISSKTDPRWNCSGTAMVGGFMRPAEAEAAVEAKKRELGEPPADLEWGYMKD